MTRRVCSIVWIGLLASPAWADGAAGNWAQFRGPGASGVADGAALPTEWDATSGKNIAWKTPIAGLSHASPIVWGERVLVTTAVAKGVEPKLRTGLFGDGDSADDMVEHSFQTICVDRASGKVLWERTAVTGVPRNKRHTKATHCNSTPATDGERVVAFFGSQGLFCYTMQGELIWKKDLGDLDVGPYNGPELEWGFASSPILVDGKVIVQCDVKKDPFLAAFDARDGREIWRTPRDDVPGWCTPTLYVSDGQKRLAVNGCKQIGGYELETGKLVWQMAGGGGIPVPTPVIAEELIFLTSNHRPIRASDPPQPVFAVRTSAQGEVTAPDEGAANRHVAWMQTRQGSYMQTPLAYRGLVYVCKDNGQTACFELKTGEQKWKERVGSGSTGYTASGVAGDGKLYYTSEDGDVTVLAAGAQFKKLAENKLGESCLATPAISDGMLIFHTRGQLIAVREAR